jgi:hypothetical protein
MRTKLFVLLTVLALLLGTVTPALAQDAAGNQPPVFCGDLSEEDCAILQDSHDAMNQVAQDTSLTSLDVTLNGIPTLPAETINATLTSSLTSVANPAALAAAQSLNGLTQEETLQMLADDPQPVIDLFSGWNFDMSLGATMTPDLANMIGAQSGLDVPDQLAVAVKLVDGVVYWDLSASYKARLWREKKQLRELDVALKDARKGQILVGRAESDAPQRTEDLAARVDRLSPDLDLLSARLGNAAAAQGTYLAAVAVAELEAQKGRLASYTTQAQFALASIYDRAVTSSVVSQEGATP